MFKNELSIKLITYTPYFIYLYDFMKQFDFLQMLKILFLLF